MIADGLGSTHNLIFLDLSWAMPPSGGVAHYQAASSMVSLEENRVPPLCEGSACLRWYYMILVQAPIHSSKALTLGRQLMYTRAKKDQKFRQLCCWCSVLYIIQMLWGAVQHKPNTISSRCYVAEICVHFYHLTFSIQVLVQAILLPHYMPLVHRVPVLPDRWNCQWFC